MPVEESHHVFEDSRSKKTNNGLSKQCKAEQTAFCSVDKPGVKCTRRNFMCRLYPGGKDNRCGLEFSMGLRVWPQPSQSSDALVFKWGV